MRRFFNTAGPCKADIHYMLPPMRRLPTVRRLIDQQGYFILHAPRQVGKTTALMSLARELTAEGRYAAVLLTMEAGEAFSSDPAAAELAVLGSWRSHLEVRLPEPLRPPPWRDTPPGSRIQVALRDWSQASPLPVVCFLDEIDALRDDALVSVLRQLRAGYPDRPEAFPCSLALIGLRDVRDYRVASPGAGRLGTASPFNIKVESLTLGDFTPDEVVELYAQHTSDTGQEFLPDALDAAFEATRGQPWLVNALARQLTEVVVPDPSAPITAEHVLRAGQLLIGRLDTHLDSLAERLREPRVHRIMAPLIAGDHLPDVSEDDRRYITDLGILRDEDGALVVSNPIYREVILRFLARSVQATLPRRLAVEAARLRPGSTSGKIARMIAASDIIRRVEEEAEQLQLFGVQRLALFGSYARGEATEQSDIDFLVDFEPGHGGFRDYTGALLLLERIFGKRIDLVKRALLREELKPFILGSEQVEAHP